MNKKSNIIPNNVNATTHSNLNENIDETNTTDKFSNVVK